MSLRACAWLFYRFPRVSNSLEIVLKNDVNSEALEQALARATEVHPWVKLVPQIGEDGSVNLTMSDKPLALVKKEGPADLGGEETDGRIFGVSYYKNKIYIAYFHGLTDGTGRNRFFETLLYYYFSIKNGKEYEPGSIWTLEGQAHPGLFDDPMENLYEVNPAHEFLPQPVEEEIFYLPEVRERDAVSKTSEGVGARYYLRVKSTDLIGYTKAHGQTPTVALQLFMAQALQQMNSDNAKKYVAAIPCNLRKVIDKNDVFENAWNFIYQSIDPADLSTDEETLGRALRADLKAQMDPDQLKEIENRDIRIALEAEQLKTKEERDNLYKEKYPFFIGTYVFSYIGTIGGQEYMEEVEDAIWTSVMPRIPMITMVEIAGEFAITILQPFEGSHYADALAAQLEAHGIPVVKQMKLPAGGRSKVYLSL